MLLYFVSFTLPSAAQTTLEKFGKSRVQYKKFNWRNLSTQNFDIYHYDNGARLAQFAIRYLETEFNNITDVIGYQPQFKTKIFIFNSISDLQQSNVGIDDFNAVIGGQTDFFKSQVEIPFTGSEVDFKKELRRGVAQMLIREMMFGGSLKDMIQNSYLGKFSEWFLLGAASYIAEGWSLEMDEHVRDLIRTRKLRKPHLLNGRDAILVGQSIWNFISEKYGKSNVGQILNYARILRKERSSISNTLGVRYLSFIQDWQRYYKAMAEDVNTFLEDMPSDAKILRKNQFATKWYSEMKINPAGTWVAYSENKGGKYKVIVQNLQTRKRKVLLRKGYLALSQRFDEDLPALSWRDNGQLGVMYMSKGETNLAIFNLKGKKQYKQTWFYFNHVTGFDFSDDGQMLVLSADRKGEHDFKTGQNDLYVYDLENKANTLQQITDDWYDDIHPIFLPNSRTAITFSSNRLTDTLTLGLLRDRGNFNAVVNDFDLFIYDPAKSKKMVNRLTQGQNRETTPIFQDNNTILYLSDEMGIKQLKKLDITTKKTQNLTAYRQGMRTFDYSKANNGIVYTTTKKGKIIPYYHANFDFNANKTINFQTFRQRLLQERSLNGNATVKDIPKGFTDTTQARKQPKEIFEKDEVDTDNYTFDIKTSPKENPANPNDKTNLPSNTLTTSDPLLLAAKKAKQQDFKVLGPFPYQPRFRTENATTSILFDPIRNLGLVLNMVTSDLLENHKFRGGFVYYTDLQSSDFYGEYQNLGKHQDWGIRFDRKSIHFRLDEENARRYVLNKITANFAYPLNNVARVSISPQYQNTLSSVSFSPNTSSLALLPNRFHYVGARAEFVYDNTTINGQNMMRGTRGKIIWDENRGFRANEGFKTQRGISPNKMSFRKIVADIRHYQPLHRDLTLAVRVSGGTFAGSAAKKFAVGGMDNWVFNQFDNQGSDPFGQNILIDQSDILFTEFVTNMRGFNYNKMAGESFIVMNAELRFPIFKYLFGQRVNSNFLKNFQVVGFYDVGSAWTGKPPFGDAILPPRVVTAPPGSANPNLIITVNDFKSPWLMSYGIGLRTVLFGYYTKLDIAQPVEDFVPNERLKVHFTLGYDF